MKCRPLWAAFFVYATFPFHLIQHAYNAAHMNKMFFSGATLLLFSCVYSGLVFAAEQHGYDMGIEGMRSQGYSIGIFAFMILAMLVFVGVIGLFYRTTDMSKVKTGEKVLMGMIVLGVVVSAIFAAVQMLDGFLF